MERIPSFCRQRSRENLLHGKKTLFVIGRQNPKEILQRCLDKIDHVYLGCGYTFAPETEDDWKDWDFIITELY